MMTTTGLEYLRTKMDKNQRKRVQDYVSNRTRIYEDCNRTLIYGD